MYGSDFYTDDSTPDEIMSVLQKQLRTALEILMDLRSIDKEGMEQFQTFCKNYKSYDPYKWYELVKKILPGP